ncbi:MAG: type II methionyl aminopeptidase [Nanoarchaeota archaeon]
MPPKNIDKDVFDAYIKAGKIAGEALKRGHDLITIGAKPVQIIDAVEAYILSQGAGLAFPAQISINNVAAHTCATDEDDYVLAEDDVIKLDCGVHVNGYIADNAVCVTLGTTHAALVKAARDALNAAIKAIKPGITNGEVGAIIHKTITQAGFSPVRNLSGHGLGRYIIHTTPSIPNYDSGDRFVLKEGAVVAIEPFATTGKGAIFESDNATIFALKQRKPIRSPYARELLKEIETYNGLPFTTRWLTRKFGAGKTKLALRELIQAGILHEHPPLPEVGGGIVSQAEHTIIVADPVIVTTDSGYF